MQKKKGQTWQDRPKQFSVENNLRCYEKLINTIVEKRKDEMKEQQKLKDNRCIAIEIDTIGKKCATCPPSSINSFWINSVQPCANKKCTMRKSQFCDDCIISRCDAIVQKYGCTGDNGSLPCTDGCKNYAVDRRYIAYREQQETIR